MNPTELSMSITALANTIACRLSDDSLTFVSIVVSQLGDDLTSLAALRNLCPQKDTCAKDGSAKNNAAKDEELTSR